MATLVWVATLNDQMALDVFQKLLKNAKLTKLPIKTTYFAVIYKKLAVFIAFLGNLAIKEANLATKAPRWQHWCSQDS